MKFETHILSLFTFAAALFFVACESDNYAEPIVAPSIEIVRVPSMSQTEITVTFSPSRTVSGFEYAIGDESDKEAFLSGSLSGTVQVNNGDKHEIVFPGLTQNSTYTIFARAFNEQGVAGPLASIKEKTRRPSVKPHAVVQFVSENSLAVTITPDVNYYKYDFALGIDADLADFEDGTLEGIKSREEFSQYTSTHFNLQPETDYVFFVRAYDRSTSLPAEILQLPVRTLAHGTAPSVECTAGHIDLYCGQYRITPNEHVGKVAIAFTLQGKLDDTIENEIYWKGDMLKMLGSWINANAGLVTVGYTQPFNAEFKTPEMLVGEADPYNYPIEAFVVVYDKNDKPFSVQKFNFATPAYDNNAKQASVGLKISNITQKGAFYEFTPNEHTIGIFFETFDAEWVDQAKQSSYYYDGYIEDYLYYYGYWNYTYHNKVTTYPERYAEPGKKYFVYYMPINANGVDGFGALQYQLYETLPADAD